MGVFAAITRFNAGELSPKMICRADVEQYSGGCRTLENFLVSPYGSVERRPGTRFVSYTKSSSGPVRLFRFVYSSSVAYVIEAGDHYMRFFHNNAIVRDDDLNILEIETPYSAADLKNLQTIQSADVMTICSPDHPVMELKRTAVNAFSISEKEFQFPPMLDPNLNDDVTLCASAVEGDISLTAAVPQDYDGEDIFTEDNIGGFFELVHIRKDNRISRDFNSNTASTSIEVKGYWSFSTHGTWTGNLTIQRSFDNGTTWNDFRTYSSTNDSNFTDSGTEDDDNVLYRLQMTGYGQSSTGTLKLCRALFLNPDFQITGVVQITGVTDSTHAAGTVIKKLGDTTATSEWSEGAWSVRRGFPRALAFFEERMFFGGTAHQTQRIWGTKTGSWDNFLVGKNDDDGLDFTLSSDTVNEICWMIQHDTLVIGTMDSEWTLSASDPSDALTPSDFRVRRRSVFGSANVKAHLVGDVILFVQRGGRKVREFVYAWEKNGYSSADMTILADHITESGIVESSLAQLPDSILWCVLSDGSLSALTYERDQEVIGWHRHTTNGNILSVAAIPDQTEDCIYWAVRRNGRNMIEVAAPRCYSSIESAVFTDSSVTVSGDAVSSVSGLDHLEGMTVQILADGAVQTTKTVTNGAVTLDHPANIVTVGLGYESQLSPMPIEIETRNGMSLLRRKAVAEIRIRIYDSVGGLARAGTDSYQIIRSRDVNTDLLDRSVAPKSGEVILPVAGGYHFAATIDILQDQPLPLNVAGLAAIYEIAE